MFDVKTVTDASKITWTSEDVAISDGKVTPAAKGVYALTATVGEQEKAVYLVVKNASESEYVLYESDFANASSFEDLGYTVVQKGNSAFTAAVSGGKLTLTAASKNANLGVALPLWLASFGDYTVEVDHAMTGRYNATRWVAIAHRMQTGSGYVPYQVFTTRTDANTNANTSGVEISRTTVDGSSWHKEFSANTSFAVYNNGEHHYKLEAYGSRLTASIDNSVIHDNDYPAHDTTGAVAIVSCGVTTSISKVKVTLDKARLDALYGKLSASGIHAVAGEEIDLSSYSILNDEISAIAGDRLTWNSADMTVTNNKVTPAAPGTYTLSVVATNPPKNRNGNVEENFVNEVSLIVDVPNVVKQASALIDAIGVVTADRKSAIDAARAAYDALEDQQKEWVENYAVLEAAEAAYQVIVDKAAAKAVDDLIAAIGEVDAESGDKIDAARAAYNALTDAQKGYVTLLAVLESAEDTYQSSLSDQQRAQEVDEIIDSIGTVTADSGAVIEAAREAYDALTDTQKDYVTKLSALEAAEAAYAEILADQAAAKAVDDLITAIGEVTDASGDKINAARAGYTALTDAQKAYVTRLSVLESAEAVYNAILEQKNGVKKVYFAAPAIFANAGIEVDLSEYSVMFDAYHMTDASKIEWSSDALSIENDKIDPEKGVYQLTAKSGDGEKTVYLVVKEPAEKEYVLYEKDFADVESFAELEEEGYFVAQINDGQSASVADGKLILDGDALNGQMRVLLPWWLADFGDYTFEANVSFNGAYNNTRWFALGYRTQKGSEAYPYLPYQVFTTRANSHTNNSGVEFSRTTATGAWNKEFPAKNTFSIYQNGDHLYKVSAYGTHQTGSIDGSILHDNEYPADYATGGIGFVSGGAEIAVSDLKVTLDRKAIERLYAKVITDAEPSLFAKVGEEIDLSQYSVMYNSGSTVCAEHLAWSSSDLTVTNGKVTAAKAGFYQLTAAAKNPPLNASGTPAPITRTVYLMVDARMNEVDTPDSNVIMPASVITYINSKAELDAVSLYETAPATAILRLNKSLEVVSPTGEKIASLDEAIEALGGKTMPAFYVTHKKTVDALCAYAEENALNDSFIVAQNGALIERAREGYYFFRGVLDLSGKRLEDAYEARKLTNEANARICILPKSLSNKQDVEYLQRLLMTAWVTSTDTATGMVGSITSGANGIITEAPSVLMQAFSLYFEQNTLTRAPALIGHRGSPSLGQPNTVDGSMKAYEAGATAIENDVYITTDGVVVVMHDSTIDATTNGSGKVENMTYAQLQQYHVDANANVDPEPIPTLEEYFVAFKGLDVQLIVEIKSYKPEICEAIVDLVKEYDIADQVNVISFTGTQLQEMKKLMPELSVGVLTSSVTVSENAPEESLYKILRYTQLYDSTFNPNYTKGPMHQKVLTAAHMRGVGIHLWNINSEADMNFYLMRGGDSLTTDYVQYFADTVKSLSADQSVYRIGCDPVALNLSAKTYDRGEATLTGVQMKVIEGDAVFTYVDGKITASADGEATVIFSLPCKTSDGRDYVVTTEPIKLIAENTAAGNVNGEAGVDTADAVLLMQYLLGKTDAVVLENCDANSDGTVSMADVIRILRRCSGN